MITEILAYIALYWGLFTVAYYILSVFEKKQIVKDLTIRRYPFVSIIIPAYNEEHGIKKTIMSSLQLDYPKDKFEIIVVVNGSTDRTYAIANSIAGKNLKVFNLKQAGKANAINYALKIAKGEIIVTFDSDSYVGSQALQHTIPFFNDKKVMCVSPSMILHNPEGFLQRIQQVEYLFGIWLRRAFSSMEALHITPGAFSAYRRWFFDKYGGFEVGNVTEDMEMALRIQYHNYRIESAEKAVSYTNPPKTFLGLLKQRRRWYFGLSKNLWKYNKLFSTKYGEMGLIVLPTAIISVFFTMYLTINSIWIAVANLSREMALMQSINFSFSNVFSFSWYVVERFLFYFFSNPRMYFMAFFIALMIGYIIFARTKINKFSNVSIALPLFIIFYAILFTFWWFITLIYVIFTKNISWGTDINTTKNNKEQ